MTHTQLDSTIVHHQAEMIFIDLSALDFSYNPLIRYKLIKLVYSFNSFDIQLGEEHMSFSHTYIQKETYLVHTICRAMR